MPAVALSGRNPNTASWMLSVTSLIGLPENCLHHYRHWSSEEMANVEHEARLLTGLKATVLVAKSFGTHVAALAHEQRNFKPAVAVLIGTPFSPMTEQELNRFQIFASSQPTLFIQQETDPGGNAALLAGALRLRNATVAAVPGNDHLYSNVNELAKVILGWPEFQLERREA